VIFEGRGAGVRVGANVLDSTDAAAGDSVTSVSPLGVKLRGIRNGYDGGSLARSPSVYDVGAPAAARRRSVSAITLSIRQPASRPAPSPAPLFIRCRVVINPFLRQIAAARLIALRPHPELTGGLLQPPPQQQNAARMRMWDISSPVYYCPSPKKTPSRTSALVPNPLLYFTQFMAYLFFANYNILCVPTEVTPNFISI